MIIVHAHIVEVHQHHMHDDREEEKVNGNGLDAQYVQFQRNLKLMETIILIKEEA